MDDLISRQAAIKAIENLQDCYNGFSDTYDKACIIGALEEVPSAQPERCEDCRNFNKARLLIPQPDYDLSGYSGRLWKAAYERGKAEAQRTGRWIFETLDGTPGYRPTVMFCSKCGRVSIANYSYCPNCGARMEEQE